MGLPRKSCRNKANRRVKRSKAAMLSSNRWRRLRPYALRHGLVVLAGARRCDERSGTRAAAGSQPAPPPGQRSAGQPPPRTDAAGQPVFRTGINFVRVDVIVTDKQGNPVTDLKLERLRGLRRRQAADGRDVPPGQGRHGRARVHARAPSARATTRRRRPPTRTPRIFVFFLDDYHVRREQQHGGAQAAHRVHPQPARARTTSSRSCIR